VNRRAVIKRLFLTAIICILSAGIVLANSGCLLACCKHCESQSQHHSSTSPGHDPHNDCSSGSKSSNCHCLSNVNVAVQDVALFAEFLKESPTSFDLALAAADGFSSTYYNHFLSYLKKLQIKIPSIPHYISNLSLLF
jgi:hypothetical protein